VAGTKDRLVRPINSTILKDILGPEEFIVFKGAGHMIHQECHVEVNAALHRHFCLHNGRSERGSCNQETTQGLENTQGDATENVKAKRGSGHQETTQGLENTQGEATENVKAKSQDLHYTYQSKL
jgi:hypothetical protein